jgi:hypothetical protein
MKHVIPMRLRPADALWAPDEPVDTQGRTPAPGVTVTGQFIVPAWSSVSNKGVTSATRSTVLDDPDALPAVPRAAAGRQAFEGKFGIQHVAMTDVGPARLEESTLRANFRLFGSGDQGVGIYVVQVDISVFDLRRGTVVDVSEVASLLMPDCVGGSAASLLLGVPLAVSSRHLPSAARAVLASVVFPDPERDAVVDALRTSGDATALVAAVAALGTTALRRLLRSMQVAELDRAYRLLVPTSLDDARLVEFVPANGKFASGVHDGYHYICTCA